MGEIAGIHTTDARALVRFAMDRHLRHSCHIVVSHVVATGGAV